jgi:hypothetical protein
MYVCLSVCLLVCLAVRLSVFICQSVCLSVSLAVRLSVWCLSVCPPVLFEIYVSAELSLLLLRTCNFMMV